MNPKKDNYKENHSKAHYNKTPNKGQWNQIGFLKIYVLPLNK